MQRNSDCKGIETKHNCFVTKLGTIASGTDGSRASGKVATLPCENNSRATSCRVETALKETQWTGLWSLFHGRIRAWKRRCTMLRVVLALVCSVSFDDSTRRRLDTRHTWTRECANRAASNDAGTRESLSICNYSSRFTFSSNNRHSPLLPLRFHSVSVFAEDTLLSRCFSSWIWRTRFFTISGGSWWTDVCRVVSVIIFFSVFELLMCNFYNVPYVNTFFLLSW